MFRPLGVALLLAAWSATIARPLNLKLVAMIHQRQGAAAMVTVLLVLALLTPLLIITLSLSSDALELGQRLMDSKSGTEAFRTLTGGVAGPFWCAWPSKGSR